jgi:hypothetical protein
MGITEIDFGILQVAVNTIPIPPHIETGHEAWWFLATPEINSNKYCGIVQLTKQVQ